MDCAGTSGGLSLSFRDESMRMERLLGSLCQEFKKQVMGWCMCKKAYNLWFAFYSLMRSDYRRKRLRNRYEVTQFDMCMYFYICACTCTCVNCSGLQPQ